MTVKTIKAFKCWQDERDNAVAEVPECRTVTLYRIVAVKRGDVTRAFMVQRARYYGNPDDNFGLTWIKRGTLQYTLQAARDLKAFFETHDAAELPVTLDVIE